MADVPAGRVVVLSASMGAGHLRLSRELARRLEAAGHQTSVVDVLELIPLSIGRLAGLGYPLWVNRAPWAYRAWYAAMMRAPVTTGTRAGPSVRLTLSGLRRLLRSERPDLVIATYPLTAQAAGHLRATGELTCPTATVITTFSVNNLWLHHSNDLDVCITGDAAHDVRHRTGRPAAVCGTIVAPEFRREVTVAQRAAAREGLGLPADGRIALLSTGAVGLAGSAAEAARAIAARPGWTSVVLCGNDERLRRRLAPVPRIHPLRWIDDMPAVTAAADVLVDNAAGMTSKQAMAMGLPVVTFRPLPGHGRRDVTALARLGLTDIVADVPGLLSAVDRLIEDRVLRERRCRDGRALVRDDALAPFLSLLG